MAAPSVAAHKREVSCRGPSAVNARISACAADKYVHRDITVTNMHKLCRDLQVPFSL